MLLNILLILIILICLLVGKIGYDLMRYYHLSYRSKQAKIGLIIVIILMFLTALICSITLVYRLLPHTEKQSNYYISLPEEISQVSKGDTLVITTNDTLTNVEFYHNQVMDNNSKLLIVE